MKIVYNIQVLFSKGTRALKYVANNLQNSYVEIGFWSLCNTPVNLLKLKLKVKVLFFYLKIKLYKQQWTVKQMCFNYKMKYYIICTYVYIQGDMLFMLLMLL